MSSLDDIDPLIYHAAYHHRHPNKGFSFNHQGMAKHIHNTVQYLQNIGMIEKAARGEIYIEISKVKETTTMLNPKRKKAEEFNWLGRETCIICDGSVSKGMLPIDNIRKGQFPVYGVLHPFWSRQGCYSGMYEGCLIEVLIDAIKRAGGRRGAVLNRNVGTGVNYSLEWGSDLSWHGVAIIFLHRSLFDTMQIRLNNRIDLFKRDTEANLELRKEFLESVYSPFTREYWENFDHQLALASDSERRNLEVELAEKKRELQEEYGPSPVSDIPALRASILDFLDDDVFKKSELKSKKSMRKEAIADMYAFDKAIRNGDTDMNECEEDIGEWTLDCLTEEMAELYRASDEILGKKRARNM